MALFTLSRQARTDLLVGILVGLLAVAAVRLRPTPRPEGGASPREPWLIEALESLERGIYDRLSAGMARRVASSPEIALATLDEEALARGRETVGAWPWSRDAWGRILGELHASGARLVVLDQTFVDPDLRAENGDARFSERLASAGPVVLGFDFTTASSERPVLSGRWAIQRGRYPTRAEALRAAAPLLARSAQPYLVTTEEGVEVWLGGYRDRDAALEDAARLARAAPGLSAASARELAASERIERVTRDLLFAERNAVRVQGSGAYGLRATSRSLQPPVAPLVASPARFGNVEMEPDADGVIRSVRHLVKYEGRYYPSLALAAALALNETSEVALEDGRLQVGPWSVPVDTWGATLLRYGAHPEGDAWEPPFPRLSLGAVLRSLARREADRSPDRHLEELLRGKIVFITDEVTPLSVRRDTPLASGVPAPVVAATALDGLMRGDGLVRASIDFDSAMAMAMALAGALLSFLLTRTVRMRRTLVVEAAAALAVGALFLLFVWQAHQQGRWVAAAIPLGALYAALGLSAAICWLDERPAARLIRDALGRSTSSKVVERILRDPRALALDGERRPMSVYIVDLLDFAATAEPLEPRRLVAMLRAWHTEVGNAVSLRRGQIGAFVGDSVIAWWGAPLPNPRHALDACRAALAVREEMARHRDAWRERFGVELHGGAGLETGEGVVGNMGARGRRARVHYSVIGPPVTIAGILERASRFFGVPIVIGEGCFEAARGEVEVRELDLIRVRGRPRPLRIFELLSLKGELAPHERAFADRFEEALTAYRHQEWDRALEILQALAAERPADRPVAIYLDRCRHYRAAPPGPSWDGAFDIAPRGERP